MFLHPSHWVYGNSLCTVGVTRAIVTWLTRVPVRRLTSHVWYQIVTRGQNSTTLFALYQLVNI